MSDIFKSLKKNLIIVSILPQEDLDLGGIIIPKQTTNVPFKIAKILQLSTAALEEGYEIEQLVAIKPSKGDAPIDYNGHKFSFINIDDIMAVI